MVRSRREPHSQFGKNFVINYSLPENVIANATPGVFFPLCKAFGFAPRGNHDVAGLVSLLLQWSGPSTIIWTVAARIVDSINRKLRSISVLHRPFVKCVNRISPVVGHHNSPFSVSPKSVAVRVVASFFHVSPYPTYPPPSSRMYLFLLGKFSAVGYVLAVASTNIGELKIIQPVNSNATADTYAFRSKQLSVLLTRAANVMKKFTGEFKATELLSPLRNGASSVFKKSGDYCGIVVECSHGRFTPIKCFGSGADSVDCSVRPAFLF